MPPVFDLYPADVDENSLASMKMNDADLKDYIGTAGRLLSRTSTSDYL